jgi:hypothetical protein
MFFVWVLRLRGVWRFCTFALTVLLEETNSAQTVDTDISFRIIVDAASFRRPVRFEL